MREEENQFKEANVSPHWSLTKMTPGIEKVEKKRIPGIVEIADGTTYEVTYILAKFSEGMWELIDVHFKIGHEMVSQGSCSGPDEFREKIGKKHSNEVFPYESFDRDGEVIILNQPPVERILARREKQQEFVYGKEEGKR